MHVQFSENTYNITGSRPNWLFDIDALTNSMKYNPVVVGNQSNGNACTKNSKDSPDDGFKPSEEEEKKDDEDPGNESGNPIKGKDSEVPSIEEPRINQEKDDNINSTNNINTTSDGNNTNNVNVVSSTVNATGIEVNAVDPKTSIELPNDPNMLELEDIVYADDDEDVGGEVDMNNLDAFMPVSPIPIQGITKTILSIEQSIGRLAFSTSNKKNDIRILEGTCIVIKNTARLVAQGYIQEEGIDYNEVFAPVARIEAIRLFLAYALFKDFVVYQMDVRNAFLYGKIEEEVYIEQALGLDETLVYYLLDNRFQRGKIDKSLFIKRVKGDILLVQVYLDNIIFGSIKKSLCIKFEKMMHKKFQMSSMGELTFFLGLQVKQKEDRIFISQDNTPMETHKPLLKDADGEDVDEHLYRSMIGSLMYLTSLRPDIILISWQCKKQNVAANSTTKAEYIAASNCFKNHVFHSKTKHIEIRHHFIRDSYEKKLIQMIKIHTDQNVIDLLTKAFDDVWNGMKKLLRMKLDCDFLEKPTESEGFEEIVDFLNANPIKYALTVNPTIYCSCVKQFWDTIKAKTVNKEVQLQALMDKKKVIITESTIRRDLQLEDANGVDCLPNAAIFEQLTLMGYEKLSQKLTFYKAFFSPQWKFLIHTILQCLSAKTTAWNEFSSTMAFAIICLATNQKFNFSKYIFDNMVKNVDSMVKFWMYPRFIQVFVNKQVGDMSHHKRIYVTPSHTKKIFGNMKKEGKGFSRRVTPLFQTIMVQAHEEMGEGLEIPTDPYHTPIFTPPPSSFQPQRKQKSRKSKKKNTKVSQPSGSTDNVPNENVPTTSNDPLLSGEDRLKLTELIDLCTNLEKKVLDLEKAKTAQDSEIASLKKKVKKLERRNKSRTPGLKRLRKVGLAIRVESSDEASLGDQEDASKQGKKIELYCVLDEPEVDVEKVVSTAKVTTESARTITVDELTLTQTLIEIKAAKPKDKGQAKMIESEKPLKKKDQIMYDQEGFKFKVIKDMFDKAFKRVNTFVDYKTELVEGSAIREEESSSKRAGDELEQEPTKKQRVDDDKEEKIFSICFDVGRNGYYEIMRTDGSAKTYLLFSQLLKEFDREDLENLWKLVKAKHGNTRPEEGYKRVLWCDLKTMFEHHIEDEVWRSLQGKKVCLELYDSVSNSFVEV
ncbi:putative ribonuclease H-like domain-containing protein [Tanacetum coccineum]